MEENKQLICDLLLPCLQVTRNLFDLVSLEYRKGEHAEIVVATFDSGHTKMANVSADSGTSMIRDIIKQIV